MHEAYFETRFRVIDPDVAWPRDFVILSACATTGRKWTPDENRAADEALARDLVARGGWLQRVVGYSPTTGHAEPSWAVDVPFDVGCEIGVRFLQDALYYVRGDALSVSHCDGRRALVPVGRFRERLDPYPRGGYDDP